MMAVVMMVVVVVVVVMVVNSLEQEDSEAVSAMLTNGVKVLITDHFSPI